MIGVALFLLAATAEPVITDDDRRTVRTFAACAVASNPKDAASFVLDPTATMKQGYGRRLFKGRCLGWGKLSGGAEGYRYAFAEALVLREFPDAPPAGLDQAPKLNHAFLTLPPASPGSQPVDPAEAERDRQRAVARMALSMLGECVVRTDATTAHGLLHTQPGSAEEGALIQQLQPATEQCVEEGASLELTKAGLRGAVALNLYRLARARPAPAEERG